MCVWLEYLINKFLEILLDEVRMKFNVSQREGQQGIGGVIQIIPINKLIGYNWHG